MRVRAAVMLSIGALFLQAATAGCSLLTSFDGVVLGDDGADVADASSEYDSLADIAAQDVGEAYTVTDGASTADATATVCVAGRTYCGGGIGGIATNLYQCTADGGGYAQVRTCGHGCIPRSGGDLCSCTVGGQYCGDDQVMGPNLNWLYTCGANDEPVLYKMCPNGCTLVVGADDKCS
jgi:hypothetical protein